MKPAQLLALPSSEFGTAILSLPAAAAVELAKHVLKFHGDGDACTRARSAVLYCCDRNSQISTLLRELGDQRRRADKGKVTAVKLTRIAPSAGGPPHAA